MTLQKLDFIFPFVVFFYGILIVFVLESGLLDKALTRARSGPLHAYFEGLMAHKGLAWICFWVGGLWSLQNLAF